MIVSYYTPDYCDVAHARLIKSCVAMGLPHDVRALDSLGSWQANTQFKPMFLSQMREKHSGPVVWLDADAEVVRQPVAFDVLDGYDVAFHRLGGRELLSGTLWIGDTDNARLLLAKWIEVCAANPMAWDQKCLDKSLGRVHGLRIHELGPEYTFIFDTSKRMHPDANPVIIHWQASRQLKDRVQ